MPFRNIKESTDDIISDEGVTLTLGADSINFVGAGVTATTVGNDITVDIPGVGGAGEPGVLSVKASTTAALAGTPTYDNGVGGIGATLTRVGNGALPNQDGIVMVNGDRLLVRNQASTLQNGVYEVTDAGSAGTPYILTRTTDADSTSELDDQLVIPAQGSTLRGFRFAQQTNNPTVGVSAISYTTVDSIYVTQNTGGTQLASQIPVYTSTARRLTKGTSNFTFNTGTNNLKVTGTAEITGKLTVGGVLDPTQVLLTGADKKFGATDAGTIYLAPFANAIDAIQIKDSSGNIIFNVDTTNQRIGIHTATPFQALTVERNINAMYGILVNNPNAGTNSEAFISIGSDSAYIQMTSISTGNTAFAALYQGNSLIQGGNHIIYEADGDHIFRNSVGGEKIRILSTGEVLIGASAILGGATAKLYATTNTSSVFLFDSFNATAGNSSEFTGRRARGTYALPTAVLSNDRLLTVAGRGYGATGFGSNNIARIDFYAAENFTDVAQGTSMAFFTTKTGTISGVEAMRINESQNVGINATPTYRLQVNAGNPAASGAGVIFNTIDTNIEALTLSNWDGAATTNGIRMIFDNSGIGSWYIGSTNAVNAFDITTSWGTPIFRVVPSRIEITGGIKMVDGTQGAGKVLTSDASGVGSWQVAGGGGGMAYSEIIVVGPTTMAVNTSYTVNNAALVTLTLPAVAALGDIIEVGGKGAGGWKVAQNAGQIIHFGTSDTTTGITGSLASTNIYDVVRLICITANTDWRIQSSIGTITVV